MMRNLILTGLIALAALPAAPALAQPAERAMARQDAREARANPAAHRREIRERYTRHAYVGPRGYIYRPVPIGYRFQRDYYAQRYFITDARRYRLPAAGKNRRWIRYGDDAVQVNIRNGRVIAVRRGVFA